MQEKEKYIREDDPDLRDLMGMVNYFADAYKQTDNLGYRDSLLTLFEGYFRKYASLMKQGYASVDILNKDTRNFLRLFMGEQERLNKYTYERAAGKKIHQIRRALKSFSYDDLYHEIIVHFLGLIENYKPITYFRNKVKSRISFAHYIQVNMRYKLCRWINKKGNDIVTGSDCVEYSDYMHESSYNYDNDPEGIGVGINLQDWVWGNEANEVFSELSEAERYLLWLKYEGDPRGREMTMRDIASLTGFHYQTIVYRLNRIRDKVKKATAKQGSITKG